MAEAAEDPWKPLVSVAHINVVLGAAATIRVAAEFIQVVRSVRIGGDPLYSILLLLDLPMAMLWLAAGWELRKRQANLIPTIAAAAVALGDSVAGAAFLGPVLGDFLITQPLSLRSGAFGSRLLLYGIQIVYAPIVLALALRDYDVRGIPEFYDKTRRRELILMGLFVTSATMLLQGFLKYRWSRW